MARGVDYVGRVFGGELRRDGGDFAVGDADVGGVVSVAVTIVPFLMIVSNRIDLGSLEQPSVVGRTTSLP